MKHIIQYIICSISLITILNVNTMETKCFRKCKIQSDPEKCFRKCIANSMANSMANSTVIIVSFNSKNNSQKPLNKKEAKTEWFKRHPCTTFEESDCYYPYAGDYVEGIKKDNEKRESYYDDN